MVTVKELCKHFEDAGYYRYFDVINSVPAPKEQWIYAKTNILGTRVRYKFEIIDGITYLVYISNGVYIRWDLNNLSFYKYPDEDVSWLGYWDNLDKMKRWVDDIANPGDEPLMVLDNVIYGYNNEV